MDEKEREILKCLGDCWNLFLDLPVLHGSDRHEFLTAMHAAENIVMSRGTFLELLGETDDS